MDKVIVTGATGFIGRNTIPLLLSNGFEVHAITSKSKPMGRRGLFWHSVDLFDYEKVAALCSTLAASHLLHLAWHDVPAERMTSPMNMAWVEGSLRLIHEFDAHGGQRVVMGGSCAEYDWKYGYCSEHITPLKPDSLYGKCKAALHTKAEEYCQERGISYANGRIFFVYGPNEPEERFVAQVINSLLENREAEVKNGNLYRDYLHVEDVANALVSLLVSDIQGAVNIASDEPVSLADIARIISRKVQKEKMLRIHAQRTPMKQWPLVAGDNGRLRDELGWSPKYDLETGIRSTIEWWKDRNRIKLTLN